ncbi:unnamed protein product [Closterium sp. NIES-53]
MLAQCRAALHILALPAPPTRRAMLQPARRTLLLRASRPAAACTSRPAAARASRSAAPRLTPCCSQRVAPCCPARRALLQPARRALLQPARRALLPCASRPAAVSASRPTAASARLAATTGAAAARASAAAGGGAAGSAADAGGAGGATGSAGGAAGAGGATGSAVLSELFPQRCVTGSVEAAALGASESTAALGASESAAALGARASPATGPSSAEALHTFKLDSGASRCFFRDCTTLTPLAAPVPVSLADPTGGPVLARASTVLPCPACESQVAASSQVSASGQLAASCSCRVLSQQTLLWHHCLGHPFLPRLRGMHSRLFVSSLPRSLPSLPRLPAPPCLPCIEGRQRAAPHSSEFPPTTAPLQTLHMDVWGPAPVSGTDQECYFLLVVDDYTRYTTVFPLRRKAHVSGRRIGLIMEVVRTSMIHSDAPHFLWPFAVRYAAHQLNLWPRVSEPETLPTLRWTGKVGDALCFGSEARSSLFAMPKQASSPLALSAASSLASPPMPRRGSFTTRTRVESLPLTSLSVTIGYTRTRPTDPPSLVEPLEISSDSFGPAEGGDPAADDTAATPRSPRLETPPGFPPRPSSPPPQPATVDFGAESTGVEPGGAETKGEGSGGAATRGAGSGGAATGGAGSWGATTGGTDFGGPASPSGGGTVGDPAGGLGVGQPPQPDLLETLSPQVIRAWIVRRGSPSGGGYDPAGAGGAGAGGTGGTRGAGAAGAGGAAGARGATGAIGTGGAGATAGDASAGGAGAASTAMRRPFFYPQPQSSLPLPDSSLTEHREPETCASTPVHARRVARPRPPTVPGTHGMALRPSSVPLCVVLPEPPASSLPHVLDPESDLSGAARPTVTRLLATVIIDPELESPAAFALVTELVEFAARSRLDYVASLVTESESVFPPSVGGELALGSDVLDDKKFDLECLAAVLPRFASMLLCPE